MDRSTELTWDKLANGANWQRNELTGKGCKMATVSCFKRKKCMEQSLLCSRLMICQFLNLKHYHRTKDYTDRATPISSFYNQSAIEQVARQVRCRDRRKMHTESVQAIQFENNPILRHCLLCSGVPRWPSYYKQTPD